MIAAPYRVALVGIDGAGKTSVADRIRARAGADPAVAVLHAVRPHEAPDAPFHALSRTLTRFSVAADRIGAAELKIAAFYLQLRTYAPIERFFVDTLRPAVVVSDRHPVVDTLAYLPLYGRLAGRGGVAGGRSGAAPAEPAGWVGAVGPEVVAAAAAWAGRLGCGGDLWRLGREILALHAEPPERLVGEFSARFRTGLPDRVVLLDLGVPEALRRLGGRDRSPELHETPARLAAVRRAYDRALARLAGSTTTDVRRVSCAGRSVDDVVDEIVAALPARLALGAGDPVGAPG